MKRIDSVTESCEECNARGTLCPGNIGIDDPLCPLVPFIWPEEILKMLIDAYHAGYFDCDNRRGWGKSRDIAEWERVLGMKEGGKV